jgi:hypothetical protein
MNEEILEYITKGLAEILGTVTFTLVESNDFPTLARNVSERWYALSEEVGESKILRFWELQEAAEDVFDCDVFIGADYTNRDEFLRDVFTRVHVDVSSNKTHSERR